MLDLSFHGSHERIQQAAKAVADLCRDRGFPEQRLDEVTTVVTEALSNAAKHGNGGNPDLPVRLQARAENADLLVEIQDGGRGPDRIPPLPDLDQKISGMDRPSGWGLFLMRSFASEITFIRRPPRGHTVRLRFGPETPELLVEPRIESEPVGG